MRHPQQNRFFVRERHRNDLRVQMKPQGEPTGLIALIRGHDPIQAGARHPDHGGSTAAQPDSRVSLHNRDALQSRARRCCHVHGWWRAGRVIIEPELHLTKQGRFGPRMAVEASSSVIEEKAAGAR